MIAAGLGPNAAVGLLILAGFAVLLLAVGFILLSGRWPK